MGSAVVGRVEADPVHAGVELEPHLQRPRQARALQRFQLPGRVHHAPQILLGDQRQFVGFEEALEQQDRRTDAGRAQLQRLLDAGHREAVGLLRQRLGAAHRAVAVGVGLDHREGAGTAELAGQAVVVTQGVEIDQGTGWTHGGVFL
ncbi:hypothetical protein D3C78_1232080 [compost metagenome]